jgi:hypothetical protein
MVLRTAIHAAALAVSCATLVSDAQAFDQTRYPDLRGQWRRAETGTFRFDPSKPWGPGQEAPLTAEYQSIFEANLLARPPAGRGSA